MLHVPHNIESAIAVGIATSALGGPWVWQVWRAAQAVEPAAASGAVADVVPVDVGALLTSAPGMGALVLLWLLAGRVQSAVDRLTTWRPVVEIVHRYPRRKTEPGDEEVTGVHARLTDERPRDE